MAKLTLSVRRLAEFLLRGGSIDKRFSGFDRALEGAQLHRKLQRAAVKQYPDYAAEVSLKQGYTVSGVEYLLEGRADGVFTAEDGVVTIDEIKTTTLPPQDITEDHAPEHWAQGKLYAAIYAVQQEQDTMRVQLRYLQVEENQLVVYERMFRQQELNDFVDGLLREYAPWALRAEEWKRTSRESLQVLSFPFNAFRPGQRAMMQEVYQRCLEGGALLCQAPTGIGKTMSALFPALKALGQGVAGPVFYLTARGTTRAAAEQALSVLQSHDVALKLRSITLTAKDKICLCEQRECTPEACPYANGYYDRIKDALWEALDATTLRTNVLQEYARKHQVCPFELGLDLSLWCDVIVGDYNYLFDPVVRLQRFFESKGEYLFLIDEAHNLPDRARDMHSTALLKSDVYAARKLLGKGKSALKTALGRVNDRLKEWRIRCEEAAKQNARFGKVFFSKERDEELDRLLLKLCEHLKSWLEDHREPGEVHDHLLQLYFDARAWLRVAETYDDHFVWQATAFGSDVRITQLCLDPSAFLEQDFALGHAAVLFSATLAPAMYYKDLCGIPNARAVALRSPFDPAHFGLWCAGNVSTRYQDRASGLRTIADYLAAMVRGRVGNYLAFFPSYAYMEQVWQQMQEAYPDWRLLKQENSMDDEQREAFLQQFQEKPQSSLLGFAVMGGVFGEGVDLVGSRLIGVAVIGPGLPQVNARQEQLRTYFDETRGSGFDYAYRYPGMNKVLQAAGRVIRAPEDKGIILLLDDRFGMPDYRRLMPPHWGHLRFVQNAEDFESKLATFWDKA